MECFWKVQRKLSGQAPYHELKTGVSYQQCHLDAKWSLTKDLVKKLKASQRAMERKMLNVKLKDRLRQRIRVTDIVQYVINAKWKWDGHITQMKDNGCTIGSREWRIKGERSVGRPNRRWGDDIVGQQGAGWTRIAKEREAVGLWLRATSCSGRKQPGREEKRGDTRLTLAFLIVILSLQTIRRLGKLPLSCSNTRCRCTARAVEY